MGSDWKKSRGFSLLELLVVIAILAILSTLTVAGFNSIVASSRMDLAGRIVFDEIALARQTALSRNENVQLHFQKKTRPGSAEETFCSVQTFIVNKSNPANNQPFKQASLLPEGVALESSNTYSPLLERAPLVSGKQDRFLTFRPNGEMEPIAGLDFQNLPDWCVTLVPERSLGKSLSEIADFITIQIDPLTSRPRSYRP